MVRLPPEPLRWKSLWSQYLYALHWAIATLSDRHDNSTPQTAQQAIFGLCVQLVGVVSSAYVIGNVAFAVDSASEANRLFRLRVDYVGRFIKHEKLPQPLQARIMVKIPIPSTTHITACCC